jgi:hypothetical protein
MATGVASDSAFFGVYMGGELILALAASDVGSVQFQLPEGYETRGMEQAEYDAFAKSCQQPERPLPKSPL